MLCAPPLTFEGQNSSLATAVRRRIRGRILTFLILTALTSVWLFAQFDLDQCIEQSQPAADSVFTYSTRRLFTPRVDVCLRTDMATTIERVVTWRELGR